MSPETFNGKNEQRQTAIDIHGEEAVKRALAHFIDPSNPMLEVVNLSTNLTHLLLDHNGSESASQKELIAKLRKIALRLKTARRFDQNYLGHMLSQPSIPSYFANYLATIIGSNTVAQEVSILETEIEKEASEYILERIIGYKRTGKITPSGTFTSGGTLANLTALTVARKIMPRKYPDFYKKDVDQNGFAIEWFSGSKMAVLVSPMCHYSIPKAIGLLGGPSREIEIVHVKTKDFKMSIEDLEKKIEELKRAEIPIMAIIGIAGETETGLVDPLQEISEIAKRENIFSLADGAYGAAYTLSRNRDLFKGLDQFDAVVWDPHKTAYATYGIGFVGFKNVRDHIELGRRIDATYVGLKTDEDEELETEALLKQFLGAGADRALGGKRLEGSMGAVGPLTTIAIKETLGIEGLSTVLDITLDNIDFLYERLLRSPYLIPVPTGRYPDLNLLCFGLKPEVQVALGLNNYDKKIENKLTSDFINKSRNVLDKGIKSPGGFFFSSTSLKMEGWSQERQNLETPVWRACLMHPLTTPKIIDAAINGLEKYITKQIDG